MEVAYTLAYYDTEIITAVKSFKVEVPGVIAKIYWYFGIKYVNISVIWTEHFEICKQVIE